MEESPQILLQPKNPLDLSPEDLEPLAEALRELDSEYEVRIIVPKWYADYIAAYKAGKEAAAGAAEWTEVLTVWVPATMSILSPIIAIVWSWWREQKRGQQTHGEQRPMNMYYIQYNINEAKTTKVVNMSDPDKEPESREPTEQEGRTRQPPTIKNNDS